MKIKDINKVTDHIYELIIAITMWVGFGIAFLYSWPLIELSMYAFMFAWFALGIINIITHYHRRKNK
jgi:fatty-acid desaturase